MALLMGGNQVMNATERLCEILRVRLPIVQAPMAGVSTPELAAAVSNAGGLGSVAIGAMTLEQAAEAIDATRRKTNASFNVNVFAHRRNPPDARAEAAWREHMAPLFAEFDAAPPSALREVYSSFQGNDALLDLLCEARPPVVSFHFGCPEPHAVSRLKDAGVVLAASATNPADALQLEKAGIDVVVAQGLEAGGHRGVFDENGEDQRLPTFVLVPQVVDAVRAPVLAAGGIMDGRGIAAARMLGAAGVQMGTAFVACPESAASPPYKAMLASERAANTRLTRVISGRPARGLSNRLTWALEPFAADAPPYPFAYDAAKALHAAAAARGSQEFAAMWAGQGAPLARAEPAAELVARLAHEATRLLGRP